MNRLRAALTVGLLVLLALCEARTLRLPELERRGRLVTDRLRGVELPPGSGTAFFFDPAYRDFLAGVARKTPRDATIAVLVPKYPDVYRYQAVYTLAPRRVVDEDRIGEAQWIAAWKDERSRVSKGLPIGDGLLLAR